MGAVTLHVSGHIRDNTDPFEWMSGARITSYDGTVREVSTRVLEDLQTLGYEVEVIRVWTLNGWLREVRAVVKSKPDDDRGVGMWHVFTEPSEQWTVTTEGVE